MAILTEDMKRVVREQRLGFYATVCEDGSPNLSPKGTTHVLDDDHLFFADIRSPQTVANIRRGSLVEVNSSTRSCARATASRVRPGPRARHEPLRRGRASGCAKPDRRWSTASAPSWSSRCARRGRRVAGLRRRHRRPRPT